MRGKLKKIGCYILVIILLPYIVTVFLNGPMIVSKANVEEMKVKVQNESSEVTSVSLKDYGIGILAREIPASHEIEMLKAQAIMVRTKLYKSMQENGRDVVFSEEFWTQSEMQEAWEGLDFYKYYNKLESAWQATESQVLMYEEKLIYTPFFSLSNGSTRDGEELLGKNYPYLKIKECPLDIEETEQLQTITLDAKLHAKNQKEDGIGIEVISLDSAGYVLKVRVGEEEINGEEFRKNYNLASSCFSVQEYEGKIRITTRGVGHGIGLSQNTGNKMAENGATAKEILEYFYEGAAIREIADVVIMK